MTGEELLKKINEIMENQRKMSEQITALSVSHSEDTPEETPEESPVDDANPGGEFKDWLSEMLGGETE